METFLPILAPCPSYQRPLCCFKQMVSVITNSGLFTDHSLWKYRPLLRATLLGVIVDRIHALAVLVTDLALKQTLSGDIFGKSVWAGLLVQAMKAVQSRVSLRLTG